ncbi:MAG TPA: PEP-CTERM sorting domain-containing protein [Candidatus Accumulibacter phosphatis]|nr:MAG: hypothetical protein AW07_03284 [Candidatus Accumulibacter sp. SK-11]HAY28607.1 PEP-CTERM sorting domain-containing protein [Accumulibacter sp.]HRL78257.1 PEP-CTERM sorting domain-containing protein [Candidatus Accumulibacter phosphatis]HRQ96588.1 PEP-CTERM sorting domain-containing protein [Candidatus Accumulibacter phosphatis]
MLKQTLVRMNLATGVTLALFLPGVLNHTHAAELTCTQAAPCTVAELLIPGNYFVASRPLGVNHKETMKFHNFEALVGDFGGAGISAWGTTGTLVLEPRQTGGINPWRIESSPPLFGSISYTDALKYDVEYSGFYMDVHGDFHPVGLGTAALKVEFGQFANSGGLALTGVVEKTLATPDGSSFHLGITCQELEVNVFLGCGDQEGRKQTPWDSFHVDNLTVVDVISLDYVEYLPTGGYLEVVRIENTFMKAMVTPEPGSILLVCLGLGIIGFRRRLSGNLP